MINLTSNTSHTIKSPGYDSPGYYLSHQGCSWWFKVTTTFLLLLRSSFCNLSLWSWTDRPMRLRSSIFLKLGCFLDIAAFSVWNSLLPVLLDNCQSLNTFKQQVRRCRPSGATVMFLWFWCRDAYLRTCLWLSGSKRSCYPAKFRWRLRRVLQKWRLLSLGRGQVQGWPGTRGTTVGAEFRFGIFLKVCWVEYTLC